ncbi:MAG: hypothetical protein ABIS39_07705 [Sphingomicrobium sp.]
MLKFVTLSLAASAVMLAPAQAQGTNQPATNGASTTTAEKKVCKRVLRSGTNAREKYCLTKAEWKKIEDDR